MLDLIRRLLAIVVSILGTVWVGVWERLSGDISNERMIAGSILLVFLISFALWDVFDWLRSRPKKFSKDSKIIAYMQKWLRRPGRVAMVTRDLSWASDSVLELLSSKAQHGDLRLYTHPSNPHIKFMKERGAEVYLFPVSFSSSVPFTITGYGKTSERVAIAVPGNPHTIAEYGRSSVEMELAKNFLKLVENESSKAKL